MLSKDVGMHIMHVHSAMLAQQIAEPHAVQHRAGAEDPSARPAGTLLGDMGQNVHRIAHNQNDCRRILLQDFIHDVLDNFGVSLQQRQTRFSGPLLGPGRNDNQMCIGIVSILASRI